MYISNTVYALDIKNYITAKFGRTINTVPKIVSPQLQNDYVKYKKYPSVLIGVGKDFGRYLSSEVNISHNKYYTKKSFTNSISNTNLHLGVVYRLFDSTITPYATAGGGLSFNKISSLKVANYDYIEHNKLSPSYYAGVGLQYKCLEGLFFDTSYKYTYQGSIKGSKNLGSTLSSTDENRVKFKMNTSEILFGIKYLL
jgi:opacity protein-like surface antigen